MFLHINHLTLLPIVHLSFIEHFTLCQFVQVIQELLHSFPKFLQTMADIEMVEFPTFEQINLVMENFSLTIDMWMTEKHFDSIWKDTIWKDENHFWRNYIECGRNTAKFWKSLSMLNQWRFYNGVKEVYEGVMNSLNNFATPVTPASDS